MNEAKKQQYETCKLYNPEKDECKALLEMYCKREHCKFHIDKNKKGWGEK